MYVVQVHVDRYMYSSFVYEDASVITKTCPCNIQSNFSAVKMKMSLEKMLMFLILLLKTLFVGTS